MNTPPKPINLRMISRLDYEHWARSCQIIWSGGLFYWWKARKANNPEPEFTDSKGGSYFDWAVAVMQNNPLGPPCATFPVDQVASPVPLFSDLSAGFIPSR